MTVMNKKVRETWRSWKLREGLFQVVNEKSTEFQAILEVLPDGFISNGDSNEGDLAGCSNSIFVKLIHVKMWAYLVSSLRESLNPSSLLQGSDALANITLLHIRMLRNDVTFSSPSHPTVTLLSSEREHYCNLS